MRVDSDEVRKDFNLRASVRARLTILALDRNKPLPPDVLVDALQDRIPHKSKGQRARRAVRIRRSENGH